MIDGTKNMMIAAQIDVKMFYADPSRPDYINEFCRAGISTVAATNDIRIGIDRHYELIKSGKYRVVKGNCQHLLDEYELYHYPEPKDLNPDQNQKDELPVDQSNHVCDASRYITMATYKHQGRVKNRVVTHSMAQKPKLDPMYDAGIKDILKKKKKNLNYI
jgi:hypothetical protein